MVALLPCSSRHPYIRLCQTDRYDSRSEINSTLVQYVIIKHTAQEEAEVKVLIGKRVLQTSLEFRQTVTDKGTVSVRQTFLSVYVAKIPSSVRVDAIAYITEE